MARRWYWPAQRGSTEAKRSADDCGTGTTVSASLVARARLLLLFEEQALPS
eukprot:COSAG01_NODE_2658_length_7302_cov_4.298626_4_plen_51_part_00